MESEGLVENILAINSFFEVNLSANLSAIKSTYLMMSEIHRSSENVLIWNRQLTNLFKTLKDRDDLKFDFLMDHTAVDWKENFELVYQLFSSKYQHKMQLSYLIPRLEPQTVSVSQIWTIAEWQEREVFDFFGIVYEGHHDLRRLFLEDDWIGYPLRKDYQDPFMLDLKKDE